MVCNQEALLLQKRLQSFVQAKEVADFRSRLLTQFVLHRYQGENVHQPKT